MRKDVGGLLPVATEKIGYIVRKGPRAMAILNHCIRKKINLFKHKIISHSKLLKLLSYDSRIGVKFHKPTHLTTLANI